MSKLDTIDRAIVNILQNSFPVEAQPYQEVAVRLGITEEDLLERISAMKDNGLIRRIGGIISSEKMGYFSTLCALTVPEERLEEAASLINSIDGVTHNYIRDHEYNMWFTLTGPSREEVQDTLNKLRSSLGISVIDMPARKVYKIKVSFDMEGSNAI